MARLKPSLLRSLIVVHRWLGVALCVLFLLWFPSGIGMMYWEYPSVDASLRLDRSPALNPSMVVLSPAEAFARLGSKQAPTQIRLNTFDGRPVYRFGNARGGGEALIYADTGEPQEHVSGDMTGRIAAAWTGQPLSAATVTPIEEVDQWTVARHRNLPSLKPLFKYAWPNGEQVYVTGTTGDVIQYTTTASRWGAYVGAIPHWIYFTPIRKYQPVWVQFVIWTAGIGTIASLIGIVVGVWMLSPAKRYRYANAPSSIPYRGQKRWHTIIGLVFGLGAATWAFSGMMSLNPFPTTRTRPSDRRRGPSSGDIQQALRGRVRLEEFAAKHPSEALRQLADLEVKELELASVIGEPYYVVKLAGRETRMIPVTGEPQPAIAQQRIVDAVKKAALPAGLLELRVIEHPELYYVSRWNYRPLPVILARVDDAERTRYYIDPKTATVVTTYAPRNWQSRWLYHGLHSLDFPILYGYRPLWDIVVITFMVGGTALCVTSLILAWRVMGRTLARAVSEHRITKQAMLSQAKAQG